MNMVALIGNVASDVEILDESGGERVCTFRVAVSRNKETLADFFTVRAVLDAVRVAESLDIGRRIGLEGRLRVTGDGVVVVAHRVQPLGARPA